MDGIVDLLLSRLSSRGVMPSHVPYLVRDVLNIVKDDSLISLKNINDRLESLGWTKDIIDDFVLELTFRLMDSGVIDIGKLYERRGKWIL